MRLFTPFLRLPRWLISSVCLALILYLTLVPKPLPDNDIQFWEHTDKIVHTIMFGALYVCGFLDFWRGKRPSARKTVALGIGVIAIGGAIEVAQQSMGLGRGGSLGDWLADTGGMLLAVALMIWCTRSPRVPLP